MFKKYKIIFLIFLIFSCSNPNVSNLGIFSIDRTRDVLGQDGCSSIKIDKNIMLWTFADTIIGKRTKKISVNSTFEEIGKMEGLLSNSIAFSDMPDDENIKTLKLFFYKKKGKVTQFINYKKGENPFKKRFWAIDGIKIQNKIYIFYMIVNITRKKNLPFVVDGIGIAKWRKPKNWSKGDAFSFRRVGKLFGKKYPTFGDAVFLKNNFIYLIGHKKVKDKIYAYVSRVSKIDEKLLSWKNYFYLTKNGRWTKNFNNSVKLFGDIAGEPSISYNKILKKFVIIYCSRKGKIKFLAFKDFKNLKKIDPKVIYTPKKLPAIKNRSLYLYYSGKEIFATKNFIYAIYINPAIYQPILLKIPYSKIREEPQNANKQ